MVVTGTAYWAFITEPNTKGKFPSNKYEIIIGNLSATEVSKLQAAGAGSMIANKGDEKGDYIKIKRIDQPQLVNTKKEVIPPVIIGNGSKVKALVEVYNNKTYNRKMLQWDALMIVDLIEYKEKGEVDLNEFDNNNFGVD